jgi:hypothetical protein
MESESKGMFWRPKRKEITEWLEQKEQELAWMENKNPHLNNKQCLQRYVFTELHEVFWSEFPNILEKWLEVFVEKTGRHRPTAPKNWTPEILRQVEEVDNRM